MLIKCPNCSFSREVNEDKIPPKAQMATCPKCQHKFRFREIETDFALEEEHSPKTDAPEQSSDLWDELNSLEQPEQAEKQQDSGTQSSREQTAQTGPVPWEQLETIGFFPGLFQTIKLILFKPIEFFKEMPISGGYTKPLIFYLLVAEIQALAQLFWEMAGIMPKMEGQAESMLGLGMMGLGSVLLLIFYPLVLSGLLFIIAGLNHLCLKAFRAASSGFQATFRAVCYASAPMILAIIPFIGPPIGLIWTMLCTFWSYKYAHRTSTIRVVLAMCLPLFIVLIFASALFIIKGLAIL